MVDYDAIFSVFTKERKEEVEKFMKERKEEVEKFMTSSNEWSEEERAELHKREEDVKQLYIKGQTQGVSYTKTSIDEKGNITTKGIDLKDVYIEKQKQEVK